MVKQQRPTLDDALIALQKTFSRVSEKSSPSQLDSKRAQALMVDTVTFELSINFDMEDESSTSSSFDKLYINKESPHHLNIRGEIELDIEVTASKGEHNA